ncbi:MAG: DUF362 domain-containing protein [Candidatus Latescibacteria bacterium]|nr:DUF362 domain-containing protein [Candidatus Latescibacterota bacterium]
MKQNKKYIDDILEKSRDRRTFLKKISLGSAGLFLSHALNPDSSQSVDIVPGISDVSFVTGDDRREMMHQALRPLEQKIKEGIKGKQVVIKPNLVGPNPLCGAHVDAVRGVLDFLKPIYKKRVIVGDSTGRTYPGPMGTAKHYELHHYYDLEKEYKIKLIDLNDQGTQQLWIVDGNAHPLGVNIIDTFLDPKNYIISLTRLKTHSDVVATLSVKNIVMGSPVSHYKQVKAEGRNEKSFMHSGGFKNIHFNIFLVAQHVRPQLSILDGLEGMEGNGPTLGTAVEHGVALAGTDMIAVDRVGVELMGIDFNDVGYLTYCAQAGMGQSDLSKIHILGDDPYRYKITYKLHENIEKQLKWKEGIAVDIK